MSLLSRLREKQSGKFATATPATFATLEGGKGRTVATVATVTVANPANEQFADAVICLPTPGDPLAHLAELDSLIVHLAELEAWPPELLRGVQHARRTMRPCDVVASLAEFRRLVPEAEAVAWPTLKTTDDQRRTCRQCANLSGRRCLAASRGEMVANRDYEPVRDLPRRCEGYAPGVDDPDRRPGGERWPGLIQKGVNDGGQ